MPFIRKPVVSGSFYPAKLAELGKTIDGFFTKAGGPQDCMGVISPHAGYMYSGLTAAHALNSLKPAKKFIIIGPNHTGLGPDVSIFPGGTWESPLTVSQVDLKLSAELALVMGVEPDMSAHMREHSIEVQVPFLQRKLGQISIVPVCMKNLDYSPEFLGLCEKLGKSVALLARKYQACVIASSDFSHYVPAETSERIDSLAVEKILALDVAGFFQSLEQNGNSICGFGPIAVMMFAAKELGIKARLLHKSHSGEVTGDNNEVVAYYAIGFS